MPISRWRATPRASNRLATLAQPINKINPKATNSGVKSATASIGCEEGAALRREIDGELAAIVRLRRSIGIPGRQLRTRVLHRQFRPAAGR